MKINLSIFGVIIAVLIGGIILFAKKQAPVPQPMQSTPGMVMPDGTVMK
jgi:hypothetical protein